MIFLRFGQKGFKEEESICLTDPRNFRQFTMMPSGQLFPSHKCPQRQGEFAAGEVGSEVTNKQHRSEIELTRGRLVAAVWPEMMSGKRR
jgi:hypothetical protein